MGNESWLSPDVKNLEIFPEPFDAIQKDRVVVALGGVFIAFKRDLLCTVTPELDIDCEIAWCKLCIIECKMLYLDSFYRPPDKIDPEYLEQLNISLGRIMANKMLMSWLEETSSVVTQSGASMQVPPGVQKRHPVATFRYYNRALPERQSS